MLCRVCSDPIKVLGEGPICKDCANSPTKQPRSSAAVPSVPPPPPPQIAKQKPVPKASVDPYEYLAVPGGSGSGRRTRRAATAGGAAGAMSFADIMDLGVNGKGLLKTAKAVRKAKLRADTEVELFRAEGRCVEVYFRLNF